MTLQSRPLVIGTRGSPLAIAQARLTVAALGADCRIDIITTTGDATQDRALAEIGGKGLFTKEIDQAQLAGRIDLAVHSAKDLPTRLPDGLAIAGYLPREDSRDALIAPRHGRLADLPQGARVGTVSLRRQALLRHLRPDLSVETLRGNVGTRLDKAIAGEFDAVLLAMAGLRRLGLEAHATEPLDPAIFTPAIGQGAIALVVRDGDEPLRSRIAAIADAATGTALAAERAFLELLDGSCRTPIGGHATVAAGLVRLDGVVLTPDGRLIHRVAGTAPAAEAEALGRRLAAEIRAGSAWSAFSAWRSAGTGA